MINMLPKLLTRSKIILEDVEGIEGNLPCMEKQYLHTTTTHQALV